MELERVAVIKLGSLGDFVQALGPFRAIRRRHAGAHITLITTQPYVKLARATRYFDAVWGDGRPRGLKGLIKLLWRMRKSRFNRVYDLQTSDRSSAYFWALGPFFPAWSGIVPISTLFHGNRGRVQMHTIDRQAEQLAIAGVHNAWPPDVGWADADLARLDLPPRFALLVPGGSAHRPEKRWPAAQYAVLAKALVGAGFTPVILGTGSEKKLADEIRVACPSALSLVDQTSFEEIITLGRSATVAIGNDTGPMHLLAVAGTPCLVLFSSASDPNRCAPRGYLVETLQVPDLSELTPPEVLTRVSDLLTTPVAVH